MMMMLLLRVIGGRMLLLMVLLAVVLVVMRMAWMDVVRVVGRVDGCQHFGGHGGVGRSGERSFDDLFLFAQSVLFKDLISILGNCS